jgi:hypothetical protein
MIIMTDRAHETLMKPHLLQVGIMMGEDGDNIDVLATPF